MSLTNLRSPSIKDKLAALERDVKADLAELDAVKKARSRAGKHSDKT